MKQLLEIINTDPIIIKDLQVEYCKVLVGNVTQYEEYIRLKFNYRERLFDMRVWQIEDNTLNFESEHCFGPKAYCCNPSYPFIGRSQFTLDYQEAFYGLVVSVSISANFGNTNMKEINEVQL